MGCDYRPIAGVDVDIDGGVWPGSDYDKHIDTCPDCNPKFEKKEK